MYVSYPAYDDFSAYSRIGYDTTTNPAAAACFSSVGKKRIHHLENFVEIHSAGFASSSFSWVPVSYRSVDLDPDDGYCIADVVLPVVISSEGGCEMRF